MIRRKRLGKTYTKSPSDNVKAWSMINLGKIVFAIFMSISYLALLLLFISIALFLGREVAGLWENENVTAMGVYRGPIGIILQVVGLIGVILYVFRDAHKVKK